MRPSVAVRVKRLPSAPTPRLPKMLPPRLHGVGEGAPALAAEQAGLGVLADGQGQPYLLQPWQ